MYFLSGDRDSSFEFFQRDLDNRAGDIECDPDLAFDLRAERSDDRLKPVRQRLRVAAASVDLDVHPVLGDGGDDERDLRVEVDRLQGWSAV